MSNIDLNAIRAELGEKGTDESESRLDKALRYVRGGAGIALGAVAIIEGIRSFKPAIDSFRSNDGKETDRLAATQALIFSAGDVVKGFVDTRRHTRSILPKNPINRI